MAKRAHDGFSIWEVLVVIAIVVILLSISIPVLRDMRELSRRSNCDQNLIRLSLAIAAYAQTHDHYPAGTVSFNAPVRAVAMLTPPGELAKTPPIRSLPDGYHHNWIGGVLPWIDRQDLFDLIDRDVSVYHPNNRLAREVPLITLRCPASEGEMVGTSTCYAGNHAATETPIAADNDGLLFLDRWVAPDDVADGLGYTILLWEQRLPPTLDLSWLSGTRSSLRNAGHAINSSFQPWRRDVPLPEVDPLWVGGGGSFHSGGASVAMADGSVRFLIESTDPRLLSEQAGRDDATADASLTRPLRTLPDPHKTGPESSQTK